MSKVVWSAVAAVVLLIAGALTSVLAPPSYTPLAYCLVGGSITTAILSLRER